MPPTPPPPPSLSGLSTDSVTLSHISVPALVITVGPVSPGVGHLGSGVGVVGGPDANPGFASASSSVKWESSEEGCMIWGTLLNRAQFAYL